MLNFAAEAIGILISFGALAYFLIKAWQYETRNDAKEPASKKRKDRI